MSGTNIETLLFKSPAAFRKWLGENHATSPGLWLRFAKKASQEKSITYAQGLDEALCFGWIDGQIKPGDALSWIQKFTPRRARSGWSARNTRHVERLTKAGLMTAAGRKEVEAAKADGRWAAAYPSPKDAHPPADFLQALAENKQAQAFFATLNRANIYSIVYRLHTAKKPETRARRLKLILAMLEQGKAFHP